MRKKVLFIDRDGTIIKEPKNEQIDSFEKLAFYPNAITQLSKIAKTLNFELVLVSNQDGLGTDIFPEKIFLPIHQFIIDTFKSQGVIFSKECIDTSFPEQNLPTRKPKTGMLKEFFHENYDLEHSFVIGDRYTDVELAKNLGAKGILINNNTFLGEKEITTDKKILEKYIALQTQDWGDIYEFLKNNDRVIALSRKTRETQVSIHLNVDDNRESQISTGIGFFDHMLQQFAFHGGFFLEIYVKGDLEIDSHHTIEDTAITLGECFSTALGKKIGIERYGFCLPMDDCLAQVTIDFGGRSWLVWEANFKREKIGDMPTEMFYHFFKSFSDSAKANIHIQANGENEHHKIEAIFKALAKAIQSAVLRQENKNTIPSTKGKV